MTVRPRSDWTTVPETWLSVPGYEGHYEVSDLGRVRNVKNPEPRVLRTEAATRNGYPVVSLWIANRGVTKYVHALVTLAFIGPRPEGQEVRHLNDVRTDCVLSNLTYGTRSENLLDRVRNGIHNNGRRARTHCPRDHPYDEANTYTDVRGRRSCRLCRQINKRSRRLASKEPA